jgi:hypothetical protein
MRTLGMDPRFAHGPTDPFSWSVCLFALAPWSFAHQIASGIWGGLRKGGAKGY